MGKPEAGKDVAQAIAESAATHLGNIATIITGAIRDIARETGALLTEIVETREAQKSRPAEPEAE